MSKNCQLLDIWEISVVKTHIVILSSVIFTFVCFNLILIWLLFCQDGNTGNCWSRGECWQGYLYLTHLIHLACPILQLSFLSCFIIFSIFDVLCVDQVKSYPENIYMHVMHLHAHDIISLHQDMTTMYKVTQMHLVTSSTFFLTEV